MNPGEADKAAERGTWIHGAVENHIRGLRVSPPQNYKAYWDGVPEKVDEILEGGRVLWSEKPFNQPQWSKFVGDDGVGRIHYFDEESKQGYAGCCDIIYEDRNGEIILGDFKTSVGPYSAKFPSAKTVLDEKLRKALVSGVFKLKKTTLQLAAYKIAAERCLGITIDKTQIFVSTSLPDYPVQIFTFSQRDIEKHEQQWFEVLRNFYEKLGNL